MQQRLPIAKMQPVARIVVRKLSLMEHLLFGSKHRYLNRCKREPLSLAMLGSRTRDTLTEFTRSTRGAARLMGKFCGWRPQSRLFCHYG